MSLPSAIFLFSLASYSCYGAVTISPSSFPAVLGSARVLYNQFRSVVIEAGLGLFTPISISIGGGEKFDGIAEGLGIQNLIASFQLAFNATSNYNGSSLRCQFLDSATRNITTSNSLLLRVLSPPCCNVSGPPIKRTTIDQPSVLQLNCSGIIDQRGYPPAIITWTLSSPTSSNCDGVQSGNANQLYTISPISRNCTNVTITCVADTGDSRLSITRQSFDLIIRSPPGNPVCIYDLNRPLAVFSWSEPKDSGGFPVTDYSLYINGSYSEWKEGSSLNYSMQVKDGNQVEFRVSAVNLLGSGSSCKVGGTIPTRSCILPTQSAASRSSITINCSSSAYIARNVYVVYYSGNGTNAMMSAMSLPVTISNLIPDTKYVVTVEAENSAGYRENSTGVAMRTKAPGFPDRVSLTNSNVKEMSSTSFTLEFLSVTDSGKDNVAVTKYRIYIDNSSRNFEAQAGNTQRFVIDGLITGKAYVVQVAAVNEIGEEGEKSFPIAVAKCEEGVSSGALAGSVIGSLLMGAAIGVVVTYVVTRRLTKNQTQQESVEMKDSRLYAESHRKGPPKTDDIQMATEPAYEDAGELRVSQREHKNPAYATSGSAN
ncbi:tyrosine-protein phosphatase Lar-like isoform X2 [Oscarella lobularis]|uniref:tyrosine-protein phosphatase Lar-like isoform X2 n=1 Tax=Oscarella lobularis TaxID=121494 RepID=UPI0033131B04